MRKTTEAKVKINTHTSKSLHTKHTRISFGNVSPNTHTGHERRRQRREEIHEDGKKKRTLAKYNELKNKNCIVPEKNGHGEAHK